MLRSARPEHGRREARTGDDRARPARGPWRGAKSSGARIVRVLGRPDVAREVIEALMLDRGLSARVRRGGRARGARRRASASTRSTRSTSRPARARHLHDRPGRALATSTMRSPRRRSARTRRAYGSTSPTSPHTFPRARRSTARHADAPRASMSRARSSRCSRTRSPATPARCCPGASARRSRSSSSCDGAAGRARRLLPLPDPLRRAPGLRAASTASSPVRSARRSPGRAPLALARGVAAELAAQARAQRRARGRLAGAGVPLRRRRAT